VRTIKRIGIQLHRLTTAYRVWTVVSLRAAYLRHRLRSIASRQYVGSITQHDQPAGILGNPAAVDCSGDRQIVMPVNNLLLAGVFATLLEQLDGIFAFDLWHDALPESVVVVD
jgi:hypothetical protein